MADQVAALLAHQLMDLTGPEQRQHRVTAAD
jgi:hypothetical protein